MKERICSLLLALSLLLSLGGCGEVGPARPEEQETVSGGAGALEVHYIDVGQADSALLLCGGQSMLIDGGNVDDSSLVVSYLERQGVEQLDYLVCTHAHEDHVGGLSGPLNAFTVCQVFSPVSDYDSKAFQDFLKYTQTQGLSSEQPQPDTSFFLGTAQVTVLGPCLLYTSSRMTPPAPLSSVERRTRLMVALLALSLIHICVLTEIMVNLFPYEIIVSDQSEVHSCGKN